MKKMLYITTTQFDENSTGIGHKIYKQIELFKSLGFQVKVYNQFTDTRLMTRLLYLLPFCNWKYSYKEIAAEKNVDAIYLRYFLCDAKLIEMLRTVRANNPSAKIVVEIPTYPYDGEIFCLAPKLLKDHAHRMKMAGLVDRIVTFSDDAEIFGGPTVNISNAVDTDKIRINHFADPGNQEIHLIGVAQFDFWHGYDRVIEGLYRYYQQGGKTPFVFHIVGYAKRKKLLDDYKKLIEKYKLQEHVVFHGKQYGESLDQIYTQCSLAVDSLGRHRSHVEYNSSLKGKEYMAKGLPSISGVRTELDSVKGFPYYFRVPADDSPIDFRKVEAFYHSVYDGRSREQVIDEIRAYCDAHFTFEKAYHPLLEYLLAI